VRRRGLLLSLVGILSLSTVLLVPLGHAVSAGASSNAAISPVVQLSGDQLQAAGAPPCPSGWDCVGLPCPTPGHCGVVEAGPASGLGAYQYVYLNFYGFSSGTKIFMWYCRDKGSLSQSPACMIAPTPTVPNPFANVLIPSGGSLAYSFGVASNDSSGGSPFCGVIPNLKAGQTQLHTTAPCGQANGSGGSNPPGAPFFCDANGNNCSIDITVPSLEAHALQSPDTNNTVVIPVSFATLSSACATAHQVTSESEYGFDNLFSSTDPVACQSQGSNAYVPSNADVSGLEAVTQMHLKQVKIAFTDDPQAPAEQAILQKDNDLLIPVAISANVIANRSQRTDAGSNIEPWTTVKLSANMVAGILSGSYGSSSTADLAPCQGSTCPDFAFLNFEPGYGPPTGLGAFVRAGHAGTTDQTLAWLCASPALSFTFDFGSFHRTSTEALTAEQVLKNGLASAGNVPSGCYNSDTFPSIIPPSNGWTEVGSPDTQALKLAQYVPAAGGGQANAGFANLNWSIAAYYGMSNTALQNASGAFVAPTAGSVLAGLGDGTWDANGMWSPTYTNTADANAYAMPTVMYAVVPRAGQTAASLAELRGTVSEILSTTTNPNATLKAGFLPLPAAVATMANDEVAHGIGNPTYEAPYPGTGTSSSPGSNNGSGSSFNSSGRFASSSLNGAGSSKAGKGAGDGSGTPSSSPGYGPFFLTANESRLLVPSIVGIGALLALLGLVMIGSSVLSGRIAGGAAEAGGGAEGGGEGEAETGEIEP